MCTLALYFRVFAEYPIVIAANRDEALTRPSSTPVQLWSSPWIYGGQDLLAGGTWLGVNAYGVAVGVLNRQSLTSADSQLRSRGQLCLTALKHTSATDAMQAIMRQADHQYNPFNLVIVDQQFAYVIDNQKRELTLHTLSPGVHLITNRNPNDLECPRIARFFPFFSEVNRSFVEQSISLPTLFNALHHKMAEHTDNTEPRNGLCLHLDGYGTCSSTLLAYSSVELRYDYRFADGPPCRTLYTEVSLPKSTLANHPPSTM
jgi:uncharacterized protein with NRDE domain